MPASLRLTIPPLVTFLPGALLTMATVDLAMGETITGASRFVASPAPAQRCSAIGIVVGAELVGDPSSGPVAGSGAEYARLVGALARRRDLRPRDLRHDRPPKRSLGWLLVVLFAAWTGQLAGEQCGSTPTLSGFVGAAVMVPVAHLVARGSRARHRRT